MGGLTPDYRTIARFRDTYKEALKNILKQYVHMCIKLDIVDGNILFVDSSVFKAGASKSKSWDHERCEKSLKKTNKHIDQLMDEIQQAQAVLQQKPKVVSSDIGYYSLKDFASIDEDIQIIVPSQKQVVQERRRESVGTYDKERFNYDAETDHYVCPEGKRLHRVGFDKEKQAYAYRARYKDCQRCPRVQGCCFGGCRRTIKRSVYERL